MPGLELMGKIGLDGKAFEAELHKAHHLAKGVAEGITDGLKRAVITGIGIGTAEEAIRRTVESAKDLVETAKRLGIAVEQLQILKQAAKESGVELEKLADAFEKIDESRQKAMISGREGMRARRAFGAFGINGDMLHSMTAAELFTGPMAAVAKNNSPEQVGVLFRELGIKGFGPLINVLRTDFGELSKTMRETGAIMDAEVAVKLKNVGDEFSLVAQIITTQLGPALIKMGEWIYEHVLRAGKSTAGAAAFYGAGTSGMGPVSTAATMHAAVGFGAIALAGQALNAISFGKLGMDSTQAKSFLRSRMAGMGFNFGAAASAVPEAEKPWVASLAQFQAALERARKEAEELRHPARPDFSRAVLPQQLSSKALMTPIDNLVKVGNFLGGRGVGGLEVRKVDLLTQIANNTAQMLARNTITTATNMGAWGVNLVRGSIPNR